jgi:hypothetical protein
LTYTFSPRLNGTVRVELFDDPQGVRTTTAEDPFVDRTKGLYSEAAVAMIWKPFPLRKSLLFMPELRYDYNFDSAPFGSSVTHPFAGHHDLLTAALAMIVRW